MPPKLLFPILAAAFLTIAIVRIARDGGKFSIAARTWLTIALSFGLVSGYLWTLG
jgi:hypothetical protein